MLMISEEEKKEILSKYQDNTSDELLVYLKRHFPYGKHEMQGWDPKAYIVIDGKTRFLDNNKKYLVNKIANSIREEWIHLDEPTFRRTIKKYIDGITL